MDSTEFDTMEVKPINAGWYLVTMFQYNKIDPEDPDYIKDWVEYTGNKWDYSGYKDNSYVCFIHEKDTNMEYTDLEKAVLEQLGYTELDEDAIATLEDIAQYGIDGGFTGFIYYTDTVQFFEDNRALILTELNSLASDLGESAIDLVKGFGCLNGDWDEEVEQVLMNLPCEDDTQVKNALAWFAAEQAANSLTEEV